MDARSQPRRNDPCPCGSGKRYKNCHGSLEGGSAVERALALRAAGDFETARAVLDAAVAAVPTDPVAWNLLGVLEQDLGDLGRARSCYQRAIELRPDLADAHFNRGILALVEGDYAQGWREYGWRTRRPGYADYAHYPFGIPRWGGEPLEGRRLLVHAEQGFGDTIQAARFLTRAADDGAEVDLFCQPALVPLLTRVPGVKRVWSTLAERPKQDFHAPILDLAAQYLPSRDAPHWFGPYIEPLEERIAAWSGRLGVATRPRVGLAWKGSAKQVNDSVRSLTDADALRLVRSAPGLEFVSLQVGEAPPAGADWIDAGSQIRDWDDTAAIVAQLDLVIAVDTAVAHLAGAMGKEVWTLRWFGPDWRWGASGERTPWYPTMTLFWQQRKAGWESVLAAVAARLARLATSR